MRASHANRKPDLLLLQPPLHTTRTEFFADNTGYPNLGLAYLAACGQKAGMAVGVLDAQALGLSVDQVVSRVCQIQPGALGISANTCQILAAAAVAKACKARQPDLPILVGGSHVSALPEQSLDEFPQIDAVVQGEAERTLAQVLDQVTAGQPKALPGLYLPDGDVAVSSQAPPRVERLDDLPWPSLELFPLRVYRPLASKGWLQELPVSATRGCPHRCVFCAQAKGNRVRYRSVESLVEEIERNVRDFDCRQILFSDENFTHNPRFVHAFCEAAIRRGLARKVRFICQSRVQVSGETLRLMARAGFFNIAFGIESGDPAILAHAAKDITLDQARLAMRHAKDAGIVVDANFILGLPYETEETIKRTIDFACSLPLDYAKFFLLVPYPGSEAYAMAKRGEGHLRLVSEDWRDYGRNLANAVELTTVSPKRVAQLQLLAYLRFYGHPRRWPSFFRMYSAGAAVRFLSLRLREALR